MQRQRVMQQGCRAHWGHGGRCVGGRGKPAARCRRLLLLYRGESALRPPHRRENEFRCVHGALLHTASAPRKGQQRVRCSSFMRSPACVLHSVLSTQRTSKVRALARARHIEVHSSVRKGYETPTPQDALAPSAPCLVLFSGHRTNQF